MISLARPPTRAPRIIGSGSDFWRTTRLQARPSASALSLVFEFDLNFAQPRNAWNVESPVSPQNNPKSLKMTELTRHGLALRTDPFGEFGMGWRIENG